MFFTSKFFRETSRSQIMSRLFRGILASIAFLAIETYNSPAFAEEVASPSSIAQDTELPQSVKDLPGKIQKIKELQKEVDQGMEELRHLEIKRNPPPPKPSATELALNFGVVYATQWTVYLITQEETIQDHGSWDNFFSYMLRPDFDKDTFDYNIFKHALSGNYYYLFYRARGYSEIESFKWTFISSLAFEFLVETYTERPSYQDIYQTPIYGTLVGMGAERIGNYFFSSDSKFVRAFGYIFNPFELIKKKDSVAVALPIIDKEKLGFNISWQF